MHPSTFRPLVAGALLAGALLPVAACTGAPGAPATSPVGTGALPASLTAPPPTAPPPAVSAQPAAAATGSPPAAAAPTRVPSAPPTALLGAAGSELVAGELGSYTWQQAGSDAPWIIVPARNAARMPSPYRIELEPGPEPLRWIVAWAPIERGLAGAIAGHAQGSGAIRFPGPDGRGAWSLRLEADFGSLGRATWYWRLVP
jgi:hypothetical protein